MSAKPILEPDDAVLLSRLARWAKGDRTQLVADIQVGEIIQLFQLAGYEDTANYKTLIRSREAGMTTVPVIAASISVMVVEAQARHRATPRRTK